MQKRDEIIKRLLEQTAEVITPEEFTARLESGEALTHYIGFEISGYVHIGQGIMSALVIKDLQDLGVKCTVWLADWHTAINDKLDGTKETAARIGQGYFKEAITACLQAVGADPDKVAFKLASEQYAEDPMEYWGIVVTGLNNTTQSRLMRSMSIMGREASGEVEGAKLLYPAMQVADVFYQSVDIAHAGMDQRKAYAIMRDVAEKITPDQSKPIVLLHHLLPALDDPEGKMSKSKPGSALFVHDSPEEIKTKINKAFCPEKDIVKNPVLNWTKLILFWDRPVPLVIEREEKHGGNREFTTYQELEAAYAAGEVHPLDLKAAVARELIALLAPVRKHFVRSDIAAKKEELDKVLESR
ncbi:MAG: tyrosine--tRNA ligase [Candidatus Andersenbacteria bacterium]